MARNRVIYQSEAVFVSQDVHYTGAQTGDYDVATIHGVQSANYSFNIARQDVNCFGELASVDRIITEAPTVSFDTSYYISNLGNENKLGFKIWADPQSATNSRVSCISGIINPEANDGVKNYFILTTKEGSDAVDNTNSGKYDSIIGIGNASITSYSTEGSVGGLPTASVSCEAQNLNLVNVPYTGMYDQYTGTLRQVAGVATNEQTGVHQESDAGFNYFDNLKGAGFGSPQLVYISITGHQVAAGSNKIVTFAGMTSGHKDSIAGGADGPYNRALNRGVLVTIPEGIVFSGGPNAVSPKTITTASVVERDSTEMIATVAGGTVAVNELYTGVCSGAFISYISGSNPAIDSADGTIASWSGYVGGENSAQTAGWLSPTTIANAAPVKLPVPPKSLTTTGTNITGAISTLRPGDITLTVTKSDGTDSGIQGATISSSPIQSYTISFDLGRTPINKLGSRFAFARPVDFPITATVSIDALVSDLTSGAVADIVDCDNTTYDATIILSQPAACVGGGEAGNADKKLPVVCYEAKGLKLDSQSYTSTIGDNKSVTLDFSCQIGSPEQNDVGIFMSGFYTGTAGLWS